MLAQLRQQITAFEAAQLKQQLELAMDQGLPPPEIPSASEAN
jgi:hypothetical protein